MTTRLIVKSKRDARVFCFDSPDDALDEFNGALADDSETVEVTLRIYGQPDRKLKVGSRVVRNEPTSIDARIAAAETPSTYRNRVGFMKPNKLLTIYKQQFMM
jgi:hypothetical protein